MLKLIYSIFLGIILAVFVGVGIATFMDEPEYPDYPETLETTDETRPSPAQEAAQKEYDREIEAVQAELNDHNRNVSITATFIAILLMASGLVYAHKMDVIADGVLLGGIFTLLYGLGRGLASEDDIYRFLVVLVGVIAALALGYWRFVKPDSGSKTVKS